MAQAKITNHTALQYQVLFANDEAFRPLVTPIVKATFDIAPDGQLSFAAKQVEVKLEAEFIGDPESSSYLYEPECAFTKANTDVVVLGDAVSPRGPVPYIPVDIQIGPLRRKLAVFGNRQWHRRLATYVKSEIEPFERMPLIYENAFGGWDKRHTDTTKHGFEPRNTVGKGFFCTQVESDEPMWLPNVEDPDHLIEYIDDRPVPAGCGFTLPHWMPRVTLAGTYDAQWMENRSPLLPIDFNRRFFNAASEPLIAQGFLAGNEPVAVSNMTDSGHLAFNLPGVRAPVFNVILKDQSAETIPTILDTVIIDTYNMQIQLVWRNYLLLDQGPHDVESIDIHYG